MTSTLIRRAAVSAATAGVLLGGGAMSAPSAAADGHTPSAPAASAASNTVHVTGKCWNVRNHTRTATTNVKLRKHPNRHSHVYGILTRGKKIKVTYMCGGMVKGYWVYGKVLTGPWKGLHAYAAAQYTR